MTVYLETERLVLREFTRDDLASVIELDSDPAVMHHITGGLPTSPEEAEETLDWWIGYYARTPGFGFWAVVEKSTGQFLGWFHLRPGEGHGADEPELGYRLRSSAWGKGYGTEGSRALIDKSFTDLGVERVLAETMVVHTASRRVMEKAGMALLRTYHQDWPYPIPGEEHGDVEYAITYAQWRAQITLDNPMAGRPERP